MQISIKKKEKKKNQKELGKQELGETYCTPIGAPKAIAPKAFIKAPINQTKKKPLRIDKSRDTKTANIRILLEFE